MTRLGARVAAALFLLVLACKKPVEPGDPLPDLTADQLAQFTRGKVVFDSVFTPHTGLGPLFNGKYYLSEAKHIFDNAKGLRTEFRAERLGIGKA